MLGNDKDRGIYRDNEEYNILKIDDFKNNQYIENDGDVGYATSIEIKLPKNTEVLPIQINGLSFIRIPIIENDRGEDNKEGNEVNINYNGMREIEEDEEFILNSEDVAVVIKEIYDENDEIQSYQVGTVVNDTKQPWYCKAWNNYIKPVGKTVLKVAVVVGGVITLGYVAGKTKDAIMLQEKKRGNLPELDANGKININSLYEYDKKRLGINLNDNYYIDTYSRSRDNEEERNLFVMKNFVNLPGYIYKFE